MRSCGWRWSIIPAIDREHRIGSLFLNPGGPGSSGIDFVREAPPIAFQLLPRFDWIGFDPRGVGASEPAVDYDEQAETFEPMTPDTFDLRTLLQRGRALSRLCLNRDPAFLASLTTANRARDLDLLRAAVGDKRLSYVGLSWGGMLGETYSGLFPGRARALVLDSPINRDVWLNEPFDAATEQIVGLEASLDRFFAACAGDRATCRFGASRAPEDAFDKLLARLDATPLDVGDGRSIVGHDLRGIALESMYSKRFWPPLAAALAAAEAGDGALLRDLADTVMGEGYDLLYDVFSTYISVERRYPRRTAPYLRYAEHVFALSPHFAFGAYETISERFWPVQPRGAFYGPYSHAAKATPALVMHTTNDPATPYEWGRRVVRDLGNARLLTYRGDGHGVVTDLNPCVLAALVPYLKSHAAARGRRLRPGRPVRGASGRGRRHRRGERALARPLNARYGRGIMSPISRGFRRRRTEQDVDPGRLPPGQYLTRDFPVLSAGPTPRTPLDQWSLTIDGAVDEPRARGRGRSSSPCRPRRSMSTSTA